MLNAGGSPNEDRHTGAQKALEAGIDFETLSCVTVSGTVNTFAQIS